MTDSVSGNFRYIRITVTGSTVDWAAIREFSVFSKTGGNTTGIENVLLPGRDEATLSAYPNPGKGYTNIRFNLQSAVHAEIQIFNSRGQLIETLGSGQYASGVHSIGWDSTQQPSGIYFAVLTMKDTTVRTKIVILK
jgi:hypothetical protein